MFIVHTNIAVQFTLLGSFRLGLTDGNPSNYRLGLINGIFSVKTIYPITFYCSFLVFLLQLQNFTVLDNIQKLNHMSPKTSTSILYPRLTIS